MGCIRRLNCLSYAESICCHPWIWTRLKDSFIYTKWGKGSWEMMLRAEINPEEFAGCITEQKPSRWTIYVGIIKSRRFIICAGRYVASYRFYVIILFIFYRIMSYVTELFLPCFGEKLGVLINSFQQSHCTWFQSQYSTADVISECYTVFYMENSSWLWCFLLKVTMYSEELNSHCRGMTSSPLSSLLPIGQKRLLAAT